MYFEVLSRVVLLLVITMRQTFRNYKLCSSEKLDEDNRLSQFEDYALRLTCKSQIQFVSFVREIP